MSKLKYSGKNSALNRAISSFRILTIRCRSLWEICLEPSAVRLSKRRPIERDRSRLETCNVRHCGP
jgi:hypothetical protein